MVIGLTRPTSQAHVVPRESNYQKKRKNCFWKLCGSIFLRAFDAAAVEMYCEHNSENITLESMNVN